MKNVMVVGGTGFIGAAMVDALLSNGYKVTILSRSEKSYWQGNSLVSYVCRDLYELKPQDCLAILRGIDVCVFAAGIDERVKPEGDAYQFFSQKNIKPLQKLADAGKVLGLQQLILINSIFSYLERTQPELHLYDKHPYIRSRIDQRDLALSYARQGLNVQVFEVPYVFGVDKQGHSQWEAMVDYSRTTPAMILTEGGANMLSVDTLANACVAAINNQPESSCTPIGDENLSWQSLFERLSELDGKSSKSQTILPSTSFDHLSKLGGLFKNVLGIKSGLDSNYMAEIVTRNVFFDSVYSQKKIGYKVASLDDAFTDMLQACPQKSTFKALLDLAL